MTSSTLQLSGLEPLNITPEMGFVVIGERTNITGSPKFSKLILAGDFDGALAVARQQVAGGVERRRTRAHDRDSQGVGIGSERTCHLPIVPKRIA